MAKRIYERITEDDCDLAELRMYLELANDGRIDMLDPLAILELCEEFEISVTTIISISRKKT